MEFVCSKGLGAKLESQSKHLLAISCSDTCIIDCYYQPDMVKENLDEVTQDLIAAIRKCPTMGNLLIGGDINIKPGTTEFDAVCQVLEEENIFLASDGLNPTYCKGTMNDHIFYKYGTIVTRTSVEDLQCSDHQPISLIAKVWNKGLRKGIARASKPVKKLDLKKCEPSQTIIQ